MSFDKLDLQSPNFTKENIQKLADLFPHCVTETDSGKAIDFDLLKQELLPDVVEGNKERYRLEWPGKLKAIVTANLPTNKTLRPIKEDSVDFDTTENLYIEGDNLEVLKLLQESYLGKIKMIYFDPPYNTGKDFVYKDNFTQNSEEYKQESGQVDENKLRLFQNPETSGRYHSDWLSMMYPRLKLARNLLTDDGVVFISIDDNEVHNLRKMCDEIFGEGNFVGGLVIQTATDNNPTQINTEHEFMSCYSKNKMNLNYWSSKSIAALKLHDQYLNFKKTYNEDIEKIQNELRKWIKKNSKELPKVSHYDNVDEFGVFHDGDIANTIFGGYKYNVVHPITQKICKIPEKGFRFPESTLLKMIRDGNVLFGKDETTLIKPKKRLEDARDILRTMIYEDGRASTKTLDNLIGRSIFENPKSNTILKRIIDFVLKKEDDSIILDFFSGSATTAHAVLQLNAEDGGKRKFIMVQIPELTDEKSEAYKAGYKNICEIGKERIRRAGKKIKEGIVDSPNVDEEEDSDEDEPLIATNKHEKNISENSSEFVVKKEIQNLDIGFRVLRLDSSNLQDVYYKPQEYKQDKLELFSDNVKPDRSPEDILFQILLDLGLPLSLPIQTKTILKKTVYCVAGNSLYACFDSGIDEAFAREIAKEKPLRIVFRDSGFKDDTAKTNVQQILKQLSPDPKNPIEVKVF